MGFFDKNMSEREGLPWAAAGAVAFMAGLFIFISSAMGLIVCAVGLGAFGCGYMQWDPFRALKGG